MTTLENPKTTIYSKLSEITEIVVGDETITVEVYQERPDVIHVDSNAIVTYSISENRPEYELGKEIGDQKVQVKIDLWCPSSIISSELLKIVEQKMREIDYLLGLNYDMTDPNGGSHLTTQFNF